MKKVHDNIFKDNGKVTSSNINQNEKDFEHI